MRMCCNSSTGHHGSSCNPQVSLPSLFEGFQYDLDNSESMLSYSIAMAIGLIRIQSQIGSFSENGSVLLLL